MPTATPRTPALRSAATDERGAAAVELALVLWILLLLVLGMVEFGRAYNAKIELTGAVREGARAVALRQISPTPASVVAAAAPGLDPAPVVTVLAGCPSGSTGDARVRATYPVVYDIPFFRSGTWTIDATGVMLCGV